MTWTCASPTRWPGRPSQVSPTTLISIEKCPRQWALGRAEYDNSDFSGLRYPSISSVGSLVGDVVHATVAQVIHILRTAGCQTTSSTGVGDALTSAGGLLSIIDHETSKVLNKAESNPRNSRRIEALKAKIKDSHKDIRRHVQLILMRTGNLGSRVPADTRTDPTPSGRRPLGQGSYTDVHLRSPELGLYGYADLITVAGREVTIHEHKTGLRDPVHVDQLRQYGAMYLTDNEINPHRNPPSKLILEYPSGIEEITDLTESDWTEIQSSLIRRLDVGLGHIEVEPPEARPNTESCSTCVYRHLCSDYWDYLREQDDDREPDGQRFVDTELKITARLGPTMFGADIASCTDPSLSGPCILALDSRESNQPESGNQLRILSALVALGGSDELPVLSMSPFSEMFAIDLG